MVEILLEPISLLTLFAITIVIGYIGTFIFKRTGIADVIWLLLLGILAGPIFHLIDVSVFLGVLPFLSALAVIFILFDAGLNMDFYQMVRSFSRSMILAIVGIILSMLFVGFVSYFILGFDLLRGMLLGVIIGGTSSPIVISIVDKLILRKEAKNVLILESIFSDPFVIVIPIAILGLISPTMNAVSSPVASILSAFSIGGMVGLLGGIIWHFIPAKIKEKQLEYVLTLAALFLTYIFVETFAGSGAIAALLFGLVLGNRRIFANILRLKLWFREDESIGRMHTEASFFIRSFFFVLLGLILVINFEYILYGLIITAVLILARLLTVRISTIKMTISLTEKNIMRIMVPRGLAAAVMAQIIVTMQIPGADAISNIVFVVILTTTIYTTILSKFFFRQPRNNHIKNKKDA